METETDIPATLSALITAAGQMDVASAAGNWRRVLSLAVTVQNAAEDMRAVAVHNIENPRR